MAEENKALTIFEAVADDERTKAFRNLLKGKTPITEIKQRPMRGGGTANFVNTYYMTRQISLLTGFRWKSRPLEERFYPDEKNPKEVGVKMEVTIYDKDGNQYSHQSWGQKDIARWASDGKDHKANEPISIFDDLKAAYSDGIKKCLSYFGIANDVYGGKELEYFATEEGEEGTLDMGGDQAVKAFGKFLSEKHIPVSKAIKILGISSLVEIKDFKEAHDKIVKELEK